MKQKGIISTNQFVWMLFSIISSFATVQILGLLVFQAGRDSFFCIAFAWLLDILLAIVYAYMGLRFKGQSSVQYSITIFGKYAGSIIGIMFPLYYLIVASILMRSLGGLISNFFLLKTPHALTIGIGYIVIAYGLKKGIEAIARTCEVLGPIYLLSFIVMIAMLIPRVKIHRIMPILSNGSYPILTGTPFILSYIAICIIMGMYIPICNKPENGFRAKFIAATIGASIIGLLIFTSVGVFGAERAGNMVNIGVQLARIVKIGTFFERLEIIWFILSLAAGIMTTANLVWAFCVGMSQVSGLASYKPLVYPSIIIAFILSMTSFKNSIELINFSFYSYMFIAIFVQTGLELLLFIAALITGKRGKA